VILVDTSIWVDHFRMADERLARYITLDEIFAHPFVIGELAMGTLPQRPQSLRMLDKIEKISVARDSEVLAFVDRRGLHGIGIGYIDAHLLTATQLTPGTALWTRDKRLHAAAVRLGLELKDN